MGFNPLVTKAQKHEQKLLDSKKYPNYALKDDLAR